MSMVSKTLCSHFSGLGSYYATHTLGLNFTMKSWAEPLTLVSVIMYSPYLNYLLLSTPIIGMTKVNSPEHGYWIQASYNHPSRMSEYQRVTWWWSCYTYDYTWSLVFSWTANWQQKYRAVLWCFSSQLSILKNNTSNDLYILKENPILKVRGLVANVNLPRCGIILDEHIKPKGVAHPSPTVLRDEIQHNTMTMSYRTLIKMLSKCQLNKGFA